MKIISDSEIAKALGHLVEYAIYICDTPREVIECQKQGMIIIEGSDNYDRVAFVSK